MLPELPSNFDSVPTNFIVQLLIPTIIFFGIVILLLITFPCIRFNLILTQRTRLYITVSLSVVCIVLWSLSIYAITGGYVDELFSLSDKLFGIVNDIELNMNIVQSCFKNETDFDYVDLSTFSDIEDDVDEYKDIVNKWHNVVKSILISCYSVLILSSALFPVVLYRRPWKITLCVVMSIIVLILFILMVPISNAGYYALQYVCGDNISEHNQKVNKLIGTFDDSVGDGPNAVCQHETWQYLCDLQSCTDGESLLGDVFNTTEFEQARDNNELLGQCNYTDVVDLITDTVDNILGCTNIKSIYNKALDVVLCTEFENLFGFTLWPVGLATLLTIIMFIIGFSQNDDTSIYIKINKL